MENTEKRKAYQTPAVIFEKDLEALASQCGGIESVPSPYSGGGDPVFCKDLANCTTVIDS